MCFGRIDRAFDVHQQLYHLASPRPVHLLVDEEQLAQVVRVAQAMCAVVLPVGTEAVVNGPTLEGWRMPIACVACAPRLS